MGPVTPPAMAVAGAPAIVFAELAGGGGELCMADGRFCRRDQVSGATVLDARGLLALPGLVDPHVHLDKTFVGGPWRPHRDAARLEDRIALELAELEALPADSVRQRALALGRLALSRGTTQLRSHVDISARTGLGRLHGVLEARQELEGQVDIVLVAFPQEGIFRSPGTAELLDEALMAGVDAIGGLDPQSFDGNRRGHLDIVFDLAVRHGRRIDIHLHETGEMGLATLQEIAARTVASGLEGQVCVSHGFALATAPALLVDRTAERLALSGVGLVTSVPGEGLCPPIDRLRQLGVVVAVGSDNIRDSWSPFGRADQLERVALAAYLSGWRTDDQLAAALELATEAPRRLLGLEGPAQLDAPAPADRTPADRTPADRTPALAGGPPAFVDGAPADLVLIQASCVAEAIVSHPEARTVYRNGVHVAGPPLAPLAG